MGKDCSSPEGDSSPTKPKVRKVSSRQKQDKMAENTISRIKDTGTEKYPTQTLKDYYDVIHYYLEALCTAEGKKISGRGAHAELISFVAENHQLDPSERELLQNLRKHRNRISYEGFFVEPDYLKRNREKNRKNHQKTPAETTKSLKQAY